MLKQNEQILETYKRADVEIHLTHIGTEETITVGTESYREAHVYFYGEDELLYNLAMKIKENSTGDWLDFTKTRFPQFGKIRIA